MSTIVGQCVKCGYCCQNMVMPFPDMAHTHEWLTARGWRKIFTQGDVAMYTIRHPCPNLKGDNTCRIHDRKPESCRNYPANIGDTRILGKCKGFKVTE
jgi:Fe-S-cluster containining protein